MNFFSAEIAQQMIDPLEARRLVGPLLKVNDRQALPVCVCSNESERLSGTRAEAAPMDPRASVETPRLRRNIRRSSGFRGMCDYWGCQRCGGILSDCQPWLMPRSAQFAYAVITYRRPISGRYTGLALMEC